jgi:hypothetical protein
MFIDRKNVARNSEGTGKKIDGQVGLEILGRA